MVINHLVTAIPAVPVAIVKQIPQSLGNITSCHLPRTKVSGEFSRLQVQGQEAAARYVCGGKQGSVQGCWGGSLRVHKDMRVEEGAQGCEGMDAYEVRVCKGATRPRRVSEGMRERA